MAYIPGWYIRDIPSICIRVAQWSWRSALVPKVLGSNPAFSTKHVTCLFMVVNEAKSFVYMHFIYLIYTRHIPSI